MRSGRGYALLLVAVTAAACGLIVGEIGDTAAIAVAVLGYLAFAVAILVGGHRRESYSARFDDRRLIAAPPWWLHPAWMVPLAGLPSLLLAYSIAPTVFRAEWNTPKYFDHTHLFLGIVMLAGFSAGALIATLWPARQRRPAPRIATLTDEQVRRLCIAVRVLLALTLLGYATQAIVAATRGLQFTDVTAVFSGANAVGDVKREYLRPVAGVTTLTQFGPLAIVGLMLLRRIDHRFRSGRYIAALLVLGAFRSVLYAERLALLELLVPLAVVALAFPRTDAVRRTPLRRGFLATVPLWIPVPLFLVFGASEYLRSWTAYYADANPGRSYAGFVLDRIGAYYATASNNSALLIEHDPRPSQIPYHTVEWLWNFPVFERVLPYERVAGVDFPEAYESLLLRLGTPEFNNPGGILVPAFDLGPLPGLVLWIALGALLTVAYKRFVAVQASGLVLFPLLFIGCLEVGRLFHWSLGRAFPALVGAMALGLWLDRAGRATEPALSPPLRVGALAASERSGR